jgi:peptide/nickel transport system permease protein
MLESFVSFWRLFRKNRAAVIGLAIVIVFGCLAMFANIIMPYSPSAQTLAAPPESPHGVYKAPSSEHLMGTDDLGRDVFSRFIWGSRTSMMVGLAAATVSALVGISLGGTAGYFGGTIDGVIMRITDIFLTLPTFFLVLLIVSIWGQNPVLVFFVIGMTIWPSTARLVRAEFLSFKEQDFTMAARAAGANPGYIIFREILPNAAFAAIVNASMQVAGAIMTEASLSFLGLGDPNAASWGWQLQFAMKSIRRAWWVSTFPGIGITLVVVGFNLIGDGLNDALNPHLKER